MRSSFLSDAKADSLVSGDAGTRNPWFGKEALLMPRDTVVASPGYAFVSADYSQVLLCTVVLLSVGFVRVMRFCFSWQRFGPGLLDLYVFSQRFTVVRRR